MTHPIFSQKNTQNFLPSGWLLKASLLLGALLIALGLLAETNSVTAQGEPDRAPSYTLSVSPTAGAAGSTVLFSGCDWGKGDTVELTFDEPAQVIGTALVDLAGGCFEAEATIPTSANVGGHTVVANDNLGNSAQTNFTVTAAEVSLSPQRGPASSPIQASGCQWADNETITLLWQSTGQTLTSTTTNAQGCFQTGLEIPSDAPSGYHLIEAQGGLSGNTSAQFFVTSPDLNLSPDEGPAQSPVTVDGCEWLAQDQVDISWVDDGTILGTASVGTDGCFQSNIQIPSTASDGSALVQAASVSASTTLSATFNVGPPEISFFPDSGPIASTPTVFGCGWILNNTAEIRWSDNEVMTTTTVSSEGCISADVSIPLDAAVGPHVASAIGSNNDVATATFVVSNTASIDVYPNPRGAGESLFAYGLGWVGNEAVTLTWPDGTVLGAETAKLDGTVSFTTAVPATVGVGVYTITATGNQGSEAVDRFEVENNAGFGLFPDEASELGTVDACLYDWAEGEQITIRWPDGVTAAQSTFNFAEGNVVCDIRVPFQVRLLDPGTYTMTASGDKGGHATAQLEVVEDTEDPFALLYAWPDPLPANRTLDISGHAEDDTQLGKIELLLDGSIIKTCYPPFDSVPNSNRKACSETGLSLAAGFHQVSVKAVDMKGNTDTDSSVLVAFETGESPTITTSYSPDVPGRGQNIDLTVEAVDQEGGIENLVVYVNQNGPARNGQVYPFNYFPPENNVQEVLTITPNAQQRVIRYQVYAYDAGQEQAKTSERFILIDNTGLDSDGDGLDDEIEQYLCTSAFNADSDRDMLQDGWEVLGLSFSDGDFIDLPNMGANPCHKDVFLQYDYERGAEIHPSAVQAVVNTYRDQHINLHVEKNERPRSNLTNTPTSTLIAEHASYQTDSNGDYFFDPKRNWTHHYGYSRLKNGRSFAWRYFTMDLYRGAINCPPSVNDPANNLNCRQNKRSRFDQQYRFLHELGHNVGLGHGGREGSQTQQTNGEVIYYEGSWINTNHKPNYISVMNYRYSYSPLGCFNPDTQDWIRELDYLDIGLPSLDESDLDERGNSAFAQALRSRSCANSNYVPVVEYTCLDSDEAEPDGSPRYTVMLSDGHQTIARKFRGSGGFTTTVPSHGLGIDWNCNSVIEASVSHNINLPQGLPGEACDDVDNDNDGETDEGCADGDNSFDPQTLRAPSDWDKIPTGRSCLLAYNRDKGQYVQPQSYRNDVLAPGCSFNRSPQAMLIDSPLDPLTNEVELVSLSDLPNAEACDGVDNDGDGLIDEGCPDTDGDGIVSAIDNCPLVANPDQADFDNDSRGNACEAAPGAPQNFTITQLSEGYQLTWTPPADTPAEALLGYVVYQRGPEDEAFIPLGDYPSTTALTYTLTPTGTGSLIFQTPGVYSYFVRALNTFGEEGDASATLTLEVQAAVQSVYLPLILR